MIDLLRVFVVPGKVFASMRTHIPAILPLVTLVFFIGVFMALQGWYTSDEEYLRINEGAIDQSSEIQEQLAEFFKRTMPRGELSDEEFEEVWQSQQDATEKQLESLSSAEGIQSFRKVNTFFGPMSVLLGSGILLLIEATYFLIAGNMLKCSKQWSDWMCFTLWSMLPLVLALALATIPTLLSGKYDPYGLQAPLHWIPGLETNVFALTLTIPVIWTAWIRTVGMHKWIEKPLPICLVVVLIPTIVVWLISAGNLQLANPYTM